MTPKPFGKPIPTSHRMPLFAVFAFGLLVAAPVAYFALSIPARSRRTFDSDAFFWPSAAVFGVLFAIGWRLWLKRRPHPHGPEGEPWLVRAGRFLAPILLAAPLALACAFLYQPGLGLLNGCMSAGSPHTAHALVEVHDGLTVLRSPYWPPEFQVELRNSEAPPGIPAGSLARITLNRGVLGALWIQRIDFEEYR